MPDSTPEEQPKFEDALAELEAIVKQLEGGNLPLDEMMARYERGVQSLKLCREMLDKAEKRIEILVKGENGELVAQPFEPGDDADRG
jgi:exodeoxyribonuclease VII small subunit